MPFSVRVHPCSVPAEAVVTNRKRKSALGLDSRWSQKLASASSASGLLNVRFDDRRLTCSSRRFSSSVPLLFLTLLDSSNRFLQHHLGIAIFETDLANHATWLFFASVSIPTHTMLFFSMTGSPFSGSDSLIQTSDVLTHVEAGPVTPFCLVSEANVTTGNLVQDPGTPAGVPG